MIFLNVSFELSFLVNHHPVPLSPPDVFSHCLSIFSSVLSRKRPLEEPRQPKDDAVSFLIKNSIRSDHGRSASEEFRITVD